MKNTMNNKKNTTNATAENYKKEIKDLIEKIDDQKALKALHKYIRHVYLTK